jgi:hypothetical protein
MADLKQQLAQAMADGVIVRVFRASIEEGHASGYIVGLGPTFFALELIDDGIRYDGFLCLRYADVSECQSPDQYEEFLKKALAARGLKREAFDLDLSSVGALIVTGAARYPLVSIHTEDDDAEACWIGRLSEINEERVLLREIDPSGVWDETPTPYALSEITRVDFGGAYEEALYLVGGADG